MTFQLPSDSDAPPAKPFVLPSEQGAPKPSAGAANTFRLPSSQETPAPVTPAAPNYIPAGMGQPGLSSDPLAGLPGSVAEFLGGQKAATPAQPKPWSGSILPVSGDANGNVSFDSNAGIIGSIKRAVTLPGDVMSGAVDPLSQEGIQRSADMATLTAPLNPGVRSGELAIPGAANAFKPAIVPPPTAEALKAAAKASYDAAAASGVHYSSPAIASMANGVQSDLENKGILSVLAPKTHTVLNALQAVPPGQSTVPFGSLDAARKAFGHAAGDFTNPTEQKAAKTAQSALDDFVFNPPDGAIVEGNAPAAAKAVADARGNYAAAMRSNALQGIEDRAELNAAAANSGQNTGNAIRQRVKSLLLNPKQLAGFSLDEIDALNQVVRGSPTNNAARIIGNLLGGGGGMHGGISGFMGAAIGEHVGGPYGAVIGATTPLVGAAAKHLDNAATHNSLKAADALVRQRSPLAQQMSANAPQTFADPERQAALARALGLSSEAQQQPAFAHGGAVPTEAQKEAGNYKKDHVRVHGLDVTIENPKGTFRSGKDASGQPWRVRIPHHYGYIRGTEGADGDHVDCYLGPDLESNKVFVIDQRDTKTRRFDEHKCMLGFPNREQALTAYHRGFSDGSGPQRIIRITPMTVAQFKAWLDSAATKKPMKKVA